jgi:hypothetical protein
MECGGSWDFELWIVVVEVELGWYLVDQIGDELSVEVMIVGESVIGDGDVVALLVAWVMGMV